MIYIRRCITVGVVAATFAAMLRVLAVFVVPIRVPMLIFPCHGLGWNRGGVGRQRIDSVGRTRGVCGGLLVAIPSRFESTTISVRLMQPVVKVQLHSAGDHPRSTPPRWKTRGGGPGLTALLLPHIFPTCSVVAPNSRGPHGADCAPWGGSSGRLAALRATPDFHHGLLTSVRRLSTSTLRRQFKSTLQRQVPARFSVSSKHSAASVSKSTVPSVPRTLRRQFPARCDAFQRA
jgi:hypothetical protein